MIVDSANLPHTYINLYHIFVTGLSGSNPNRIQVMPQDFYRPQEVLNRQQTLPQPMVYQPQTSAIPQTTEMLTLFIQTTKPPNFVQTEKLPEESEFECGVATIATGLIIKGQTVNRGQFPW